MNIDRKLYAHSLPETTAEQRQPLKDHHGNTVENAVEFDKRLDGGEERVYLAHCGQALRNHLMGVAKLSRMNASKIGCSDYGECLGLLHDLGKYSPVFQKYIKSALGLLDPDADEESIDAKALKGKIDHSTAGAQLLWKELSPENAKKPFLAQVLALCLVSHHSGLIDCLATDQTGTHDFFTRRIIKSDQRSHYSEAVSRSEILNEIKHLIANDNFANPLESIIKDIFAGLPEKRLDSTIFHFQLGLLVRFLFSCLIDADRQDTVDSEKECVARSRLNGVYLPWNTLIERFETKIAGFRNAITHTPGYQVNRLREDVSLYCLEAATRIPGVFTLTVPTGGGKTLASLRFALHHAHKHHLDRIIYVIPFTSIIDQNAAIVRDILETSSDEAGRIVLEHHSNIGSEKQGWQDKVLCDNWDAPVVYTTMVQFLDTLFGGGTRGARRMHQLARAVIVFDEIQTLPIRCVHLFCNAINFLTTSCRSSAVLCTATQPLLGAVESLKGALTLSTKNEIIPDVEKLFNDLRRVKIEDVRTPSGWSDEEISKLAIREVEMTGSCLVIVNMKKSARNLFETVKKGTDIESFHLSTGMCPVHRKIVLTEIRERLAYGKPIICISTQLIEAGVDVDFGSVIRFVAGLDSIAQAAGRCNRNGKKPVGRVFVVNPAKENIDCLKDIAVGKEKTERVFNDFKDDPMKFGNDLIGPSSLNWYYQNYFYGRKADMDYPVGENETGRRDTLLNMLSTNSLAVSDYRRVRGLHPSIFLCHSFMTASHLFKSIDAPTQSVIVRYGNEGKALVADLCASFNIGHKFDLMRKAQQYSVNLFPHEFNKLSGAGAICPVQDGLEVFYLDSKYYSDQFGLSLEPVNEEEFLNA